MDRSLGVRHRVAAELQHPCRKRLPSSFHAGYRCITLSLVNVFCFDKGQRRPDKPLAAQSELNSLVYESRLARHSKV